MRNKIYKICFHLTALAGDTFWNTQYDNIVNILNITESVNIRFTRSDKD